MKNTINTTSKVNTTSKAGKANKVNTTSKAGKANKNAALDEMQKQVLKAERLAKIEENKAKRLANATKRFETLKQVNANAKGFANVTISNVRTANANNASVQGAINALNMYIKQAASVNGLDKKIVASLKGEAAQAILAQVTEITLPLYIDNKGNYKIETLYRLIASKAKNTELRTLLNNIEKAGK